MLNIIIDESIKDKNRDSYICAIKKAARARDIEVRIWDVATPFVEKEPFIVLQPCNDAKIAHPEFDVETKNTAQVCFNIIQGHGVSKQFITILSRSSLIGKPLRRMLDKANHTVTPVHSQTPPHVVEQLLSMSSVVISATGHKVGEIYTLPLGCICLDISGDFEKQQSRCSAYYSMSTIGAFTTQKMLHNYEFIMARLCNNE